MKYLTLLAVLLLATLAFVQAGKVTINGECKDCNDGRTTSTTHKTPPRGQGRQTTAKPKPKTAPGRRHQASDEDDDDSAGDWTLHQSAGGSQHIGRRHRRQWEPRGQYINLGGAGGGSGRVTTIDSRGYPGTVVRNDDCVGCNIRG
ncbi:uncharacterized protein BomBc2 [Drosophila pseudoobscura]|uniref:Uncharacterized protein BomBc2 n=1 Tax=Drosophila pseudoobscura pseudoobscura TaxID=46245 RepID=A0A6I8UUY6_DROPS|nr:uncharacterized protein LOC4804798 [Drosophila pseudoobscura]